MVASKTKIADPVTDYAKSTIADKQLAGRLVRLACERHLRDLKEGPKRGLKWDLEAAAFALKFFTFLNLPEGDKPFDLAPWQQFIVGSIFGWKGPDGFRRFRTAYIEAGKGCGKSPLAAGIGLFGLEADGERAAEIYTAAVTGDQARIMFKDAQRMAENSAMLRSRLNIGQHNISCDSTDSFFRPLSAEQRSLDGKRVHMALIDEIHEHPTPLVVDKMRAGTKGRKQALIIEITNSGHDRTSVCYRHREYVEKILKGLLDDDSWFGYVCTLDPCKKCEAEGKTQPSDGCKKCDNWQDEKVWIKACPNLDISVTRKYLREQVHEAQGMPAKENIVKRLNFCIWTEVADHAIPMDKWDSCATTIDLESFAGRSVFAALDIGATSDFTAFTLLIPHDDAETVEVSVSDEHGEPQKINIVRRSYSLVPYFWLPEIPQKRDSRMQSVIDGWRRQGFIRTTPGEVVDYDIVLQEILEILEPFTLEKLGFDRGFQGSQMGNNLMKHFGELVKQAPQGILSMNAPFRELLELMKTGRLHQDGNPVMRWMASNVAAETRGGLIKPSKDKSSEKIDGITAAVMSLMAAMDCDEQGPSIYSEPGSFAL